MKMKRCFFILLIAAALAAALTVTAYAGSRWSDASESVAVYPGEPQTAVGDVDENGLITTADARQTLRFAVGLDADYLPCAGADYNGDGAITTADARQVLRCAVGLEGSLTPPADDGIYSLRVHSRSSEYSGLGALIPLETNAALVDGYKTGHFPLWRLRSAADAQAFCAAYRAAEIEPNGKLDVPAFLARYDAVFFAEHELFIVFKVEGSGMNLQAVYAPTVGQDGTLTFSVGSVYPEGVTADIGEWFLFLPMEKKTAAACSAFDCVRGPGGVLPYGEIRAAYAGKTKWTYAEERILYGDARISLRTGNETAFSFINAQDGGYFWQPETEAAVYDYAEMFSQTDEACDFWFKEDIVTAPYAADGAPGVQLYTVRANKPGTYRLRFSLKRSWETDPIEVRTVTLTVADGAKNYIVSDAPEADPNMEAIVDYFSFDPDRYFAKTAYHSCTFRGVIEEMHAYQSRWTEGGEAFGPNDATILKVRVTDPLAGMENEETITLLYPFLNTKIQGCPYTVEVGKEYYFLNCWRLDETYFQLSSPDSVNDPTLCMADAVTGHAARSFLPVTDDTCVMYRGFFTEAQLSDAAIFTPIPNTPYVTVNADWLRGYLLEKLSA